MARAARRPVVLDAPSNLGLRPPTPTSVPGCAKAPGALRDNGLLARIDALDAGCVTPPRYDPGDWQAGDGVCQAADVAGYAVRLADRLDELIAVDRFPVVLGGDCSILLGSAVALKRRTAAGAGRYGLVFIDGHTDFRHPGNAAFVGAAAGEDLALVTGRGQTELTSIERLRPYFQDSDVVVLGIREHDEYRMDIKAAGMPHRTVPVLRTEGMPRTAAWASRLLSDTDGFWVHLDVDVLDPTVMPAVDAPDEGGIGYGELEHLLADLVRLPACMGLEVTVFDPDYDPDGRYARELTDALVAGLSPLWSEVSAEVGRGAVGATGGTRSGMITVPVAEPAERPGVWVEVVAPLGWPDEPPPGEVPPRDDDRDGDRDAATTGLGWPTGDDGK
jgi:arginase